MCSGIGIPGERRFDCDDVAAIVTIGGEMACIECVGIVDLIIVVDGGAVTDPYIRPSYIGLDECAGGGAPYMCGDGDLVTRCTGGSCGALQTGIPLTIPAIPPPIGFP